MHHLRQFTRPSLFDDTVYATNHGSPGPYPMLPTELIALILEHLKDDYSALFILSLTNRFMNEATQPVLYRSIHSGVIMTRTRMPRNGNGALASVVGNSSLARYVLEYTLEDTVENQFSNFVTRRHPHPGLQKIVNPNLRPALHAMVNLKHLSVHTYSIDNWNLLDVGPSPPNSTPTVDIFQLETFSWTGHTRDASSSSYPSLSSFLMTQRKLRRVQAQLNGQNNNYRIGGMIRSQPQTPIPPEACPDLEWIIGNRGTIEALLPGRKVTIVVWQPCWSDARGSIAFLAKELSRLRVLSLHDSGFLAPIPPVFEMAKYLQNLKYLEVHNTDFDSLEWVKVLPVICGLVLNDDRNRNRPFNTPKRRDQAANLFVECPTLEFIAVELLDSLKNNFEWWDRFDSDVERCGDRVSGTGWEPKYVKYSYCERILYPSIS